MTSGRSGDTDMARWPGLSVAFRSAKGVLSRSERRRSPVTIYLPSSRRRTTTGWQIAIACAALCGALLSRPAAARGETLSIKQFNDRLREWKSEERPLPIVPVTVEGRLSLYGKDRLRFKNCDMLFLSKSELPVLAGSAARVTIEVTGKVRFDKRTSNYTFDISMVRELGKDIDTYHDMKRKIREESPEKWYELGRWAESRGNFYKDDELLEKSGEAFAHGLDIERRALARDNPEGLLELVEKAKLHRLPSKLWDEIVHEAFFLLAQRSRGEPPEKLKELARRMEQQLPGSTEASGWMREDLLKEYEAAPLKTFAKADRDKRLKFNRILYSNVLLRTITAKLAEDGSNGFEIAEQIERLLPERKRDAELYREQALAALDAEVEHLTRRQMLDVAERHRKRGEAQRADRLIETWLKIRVRALDPDDTEGTLQTSDEYRRLLKRDDLADRLLIDAWKRNPNAADLLERLKESGYHLFEGTWISDADFKNLPEGRMEPSIRAGKVETGMTPGQVRRARAGSPDALSRAVTAGQVTEIWSYHLSDGSKLIVRLAKRLGQTEFTVVDVGQLAR